MGSVARKATAAAVVALAGCGSSGGLTNSSTCDDFVHASVSDRTTWLEHFAEAEAKAQGGPTFNFHRQVAQLVPNATQLCRDAIATDGPRADKIGNFFAEQ